MLVVVIMTQLSSTTNRKSDNSMASYFKYSTGISIRVFTHIVQLERCHPLSLFEICYVVALVKIKNKMIIVCHQSMLNRL